MMTSFSIRRLMLGGIAAAAVAVPAIALADSAGLATVHVVYPALRQGGMSFAVSVGNDGRITECAPVESAQATPATQSACAALTARGLPAGVAPARPIGEQTGWLTIDDVPEEMMFANTHVGAELIFEVDQSGKVSACRPYKSTGMAEFDALACRKFQERARFTPATYNGTPVLAVGTTYTKFDSD